MKLAPIAAVLMLLSAMTPAQAASKRCPAGTVATANGCQSSRAQPARSSSSSSYRSCPMDFAWNGNRCEPVKRCPYDMALINGTCQRPQRR